MYIAPEIIENITMHKNLIKEDVLYAVYSSFNKCIVNTKEYICILNIGNKYKLYVVLKRSINKNILKYISLYIGILISDFVIVNKINNIDEGICQLDIALDLGKDIYAIPGDIFDYRNYLANYSIKQGAIPICSKYDMKNILEEKKLNVL